MRRVCTGDSTTAANVTGMQQGAESTVSSGGGSQAMRAGTVAALLEGAVSAEQLTWISSEAAVPAAATAASPPKTADAAGDGGGAAAEEAGEAPSSMPVSGADAAKGEEQPAAGEEGGCDNHAALADFLLGATAGGQPLSAAHYGCMAAYCQVGPSQPCPVVHIQPAFVPVRRQRLKRVQGWIIASGFSVSSTSGIDLP